MSRFFYTRYFSTCMFISDYEAPFLNAENTFVFLGRTGVITSSSSGLSCISSSKAACYSIFPMANMSMVILLLLCCFSFASSFS